VCGSRKYGAASAVRVVGAVSLLAGAVGASGCARAQQGTIGDAIGEALRPGLERWIQDSIERKIRESSCLLVAEEHYVLVRSEDLGFGRDQRHEDRQSEDEPVRSAEEWRRVAQPLDGLPAELSAGQYKDCIRFVCITGATWCETLANVEELVRASGSGCHIWPVYVRLAWDDASADFVVNGG
jgi:hypothetical protein